MKYVVNPYVEVEKIVCNVWHMVSPGFSPSNIFLIEGAERALLIDTGFGLGNLKGLVEQITAKPYVVVNTHYHGDHAMGNYQFNDVHIHKADLASLKGNDAPESRNMFISRVSPGEKPYQPEEYTPVSEYNTIAVEGGFEFDLGGREKIEVIEIPGHTLGCIGLLDKNSGMLFSGDSVVFTPTFIFAPPGESVNSGSVELYREYLLKLNNRRNEISGLFPGHSKLNLPVSHISDMILCCEEIIQDNSLGEPFDFMGRLSKIHYHNHAGIAFSNQRIYKNK